MTAVIDSPRAFRDWMSDLDTVDKLAASLADTGEAGFMAKVQGYIGSQVMATEELQAQVFEQAEAIVAAAVGDLKAAKRLNLNPLDRAPSRVGAGHNPKAVGAGLDGVFSDVGEFVQAMWHGAEKYGHARAYAEQRGKVLGYVEKVPSEGGYLVPEEYRAELLRMSLESAVVRPRARVVPMNSLKLAFPAVDETTHVGSTFGGIIVYRTEEAAALTASNAAFRKVELEVTKQTALANLSNEVIRDTAGSISTYVREMVPEALSFAEDDDFLNGTGVGMPLGALRTTNPGTITQAARSGQGSGTIVWENIVDMYARMLPSSLNRAVWVVAPAAFPALATMGLVVGTGGGPIGIAAGPGTGSPTMTLLGRPIIISEKTPGTIGSQGDINFVDFGYYLIGDNQRLEFASSEHSLFSSDMTQMRWIQRNDGRPWVISPLTPKNGGDTLSPFVQLSSTRT